MVEKVTVANVGDIANPAFRGYAQRYVDVEEGFREAVADFGVPFAEPVDEGDREESFALCGLLHDVCKAQFYKVAPRNVKND